MIAYDDTTAASDTSLLDSSIWGTSKFDESRERIMGYSMIDFDYQNSVFLHKFLRERDDFFTNSELPVGSYDKELCVSSTWKAYLYKSDTFGREHATYM